MQLLNYFSAPIYIAYTTKHKNSLKDGYFFTVAPGYYKQNDFGIRLKNVFEVISSSRSGFLEMRVATLVPFETKLIDRTMLSLSEVSFIFLFLDNFNQIYCFIEKVVEQLQCENSRSRL